jgi:peptide chain release factor 2
LSRCSGASTKCWCVFDLAGKEKEIEALEAESMTADFYADRRHAQSTMQRLTALRNELETWRGMDTRLHELFELAALLGVEPDEELAGQVDRSADEIEQQLEKLRFSLMLNGEHDQRDVILSIHAGSGGTDAQDWAEMLLRMYLRWAQMRGYKAEVLDMLEGEEAGIKSATVEISGAYAYGYLRSEAGVHRLVRLSRFDAAHRRHTSFAKVEVMPDIEDTIDIVVRPEDLEVDTYRSTGAGGQHVNKTDSAVRMRHIPTGIVVTCQNERSQIQNREVALRILKARLYERELKERERQQAALKGEHVEADFGNQILSVVEHPYQMVKDHRTGFESSDTTAYLNGEIDPFIEAYLQAQAVGV